MHMKQGRTVIMEGAHLEPQFNAKMMEKYGNKCLSYVISVRDTPILL